MQVYAKCCGKQERDFVLIRKVEIGDKKEMTFELSFENEPDLSKKGHSRLKNEQERRHGGWHLGVSGMVSDRVITV